jgi:hypothetical protein
VRSAVREPEASAAFEVVIGELEAASREIADLVAGTPPTDLGDGRLRQAGPGPSSARARARGSRRSSTTRIVFSSGARYRPAIGSHAARSRARSAWLARPIHCPTAVNRSFPAAVNAQTAIAIRQASG